VRGDISKMPDFIEIDITPLEIGKSISVGDIKLDGLEILHPSNISVVSVKTTRGAQTGDVETETKPAAEAKTAEA
ncbi:MAG: 50S ribosomal protein L25, partial [Bacteroidia bacterium]